MMPSPESSVRRLAALVWPLALGMANNAVMQFADRLFLAHESEASLAAVLPASMLAFTVVGFFQTLVAYSGTFVAHSHGAGDASGCVRAYRAGLALAAASAVILVACLPVGLWTLDAVGHAPAVLAREKAYFAITLPGGVALALGMAASGYFTGRGRTRLVFWVNLLGNALNVALDPLLIFGWGPLPAGGITGAAIATVLAEAVQAAVLIAAVQRETARVPTGGGLFPLALQILRRGSQAGARAVLDGLSFTIFVFFTGRLGETAFAVSNAVFSVNYLMYAPVTGVAVGASVAVGHALGAGRPDRAYRDGWIVTLLGLGYVLLAAGAAYAFREPILRLFVAPDTADAGAFMRLGRTLFLMMLAWQVFDTVETVLSGALKGGGDTRFVMRWMLVTAFGVWVPSIFVTYRLAPTMEALWATMIGYVLLLAAGTVVRWQSRKGLHRLVPTTRPADGNNVRIMK